MRQSRQHGFVVRHHLDGGALRQVGKALQLVAAHHVEGQQHVGDAGIRHHLRLAQLLDGDSLGAKVDLRPGQRHQLVGLDMWAVGEAGGVAALLPAAQIAFHHVDVDDGHGGFEVLQALACGFEVEIAENVHVTIIVGPGMEGNAHRTHPSPHLYGGGEGDRARNGPGSQLWGAKAAPGRCCPRHPAWPRAASQPRHSLSTLPKN